VPVLLAMAAAARLISAICSASPTVFQAPASVLLRCTCTYADEPVIVDVAPSADPYHVVAVPVGRRFAFRAVWLKEAGREVLELVAYHATKAGDVPLTQVTYRAPFPPVAAEAPFGFTGLHRVYEPDLGSELTFWCAWGAP